MEKLRSKTKMVKKGEGLRYSLSKDLTKGQLDALMLMIDFASRSSKDIFILKGYGGTGKTYLVKHFINYITSVKSLNGRIAITAPTNKAVSVLKARGDFGGDINYSTIHSLLGLTENIDKNGNITFVNNGKANSTLATMRYLIVDETSMLQDEIFQLLLNQVEYVKMIFMGDPAQIPPVGKDDCLPFKKCYSTNYEEGYTLTEIMRQQLGNPIIEACMKIRENLKSKQPIPILRTKHDSKGHGITWLDSQTEKDTLLNLFDQYFVSKEFMVDSDYVKVIAWRNKTVNMINTRIRQMMYGQNVTKIMPGEKLLANKPVIIFEDSGKFKKAKVLVNTSEEFEINSINVSSKVLLFGGRRLKVKIYECDIFKEESIRIIHEDSEEEFASYLKALKDRAIGNKGANGSWIDYYDAVKWPADVAYNYAITAHKSQGSTYENVFVIEDDLDTNNNTVERNRIKYTSYSRASNKLYIYRINSIKN